MQRYGAYKDSGVEWIGEIPEGWEISKFRWVLEKVSREPLSEDEVVTCFRDGEVTLRTNRRTDGFTMSDKEIGYQHICKGDFVIHGMDGFAGAMGISDSDGKASPVLMVFNARGADNLRYMNYLLRFYAWQDVFLSLSTTIRVRSCDLNWGKVAPIPVVLPFPKEQRAIADYLDEKTAEIDSIVSQTERSIELLREYRKSVISEAVTKGLNPDAPMRDSGVEWIGEIPEGWELLRMKNIGSFVKGSGIKKDEVLPEGMPCIRYGELYTTYEHRIASPASFVSDELFSRSVCLRDGEVVFALTGENEEDIGRCVVNLSGEPLAVGGDTLAFTGHRQDGRFIAYSCNSKYFNVQRTLFARGGIIVHLPASAVSNATIALPPLPEQRAIADYLDAKTAEIDSLIADKQRQVELLKEYRKSLISEAVTGKFKVPGLE